MKQRQSAMALWLIAISEDKKLVKEINEADPRTQEFTNIMIREFIKDVDAASSQLDKKLHEVRKDS